MCTPQLLLYVLFGCLVTVAITARVYIRPPSPCEVWTALRYRTPDVDHAARSIRVLARRLRLGFYALLIASLLLEVLLWPLVLAVLAGVLLGAPWAAWCRRTWRRGRVQHIRLAACLVLLDKVRIIDHIGG